MVVIIKDVSRLVLFLIFFIVLIVMVLLFFFVVFRFHRSMLYH